MNLAARVASLFLVLFPVGCRDDASAPGAGAFNTVLVVPGNEPLDESTPTVDMIARVMKAVEFQRQHPLTLLVFTGGRTGGARSEARMMADLAVAQGVATNIIRLEENARSTRENARFTASLIHDIRAQRILIVSKSDHLDWAMSIFREEKIFRNAEPLECQVAAADSMAQMRDYLIRHPDNQRVRERLQSFKDGRKGTD
jgi:uncharacterized SAM-binding protein YcdF (DUF218 family)